MSCAAPGRRDRRAGRHRRPSPTRRSSSAASTSSSPMPASPRPRRSRTPTLELWNRNMDILATGYFLVVARGLPPDEAAEDSAAPSSSSPPRTASPPRPTPPPIAPPRPPRSISPAAWRWKARELGIRVNVGQPRRGAARLEDLDRRMARAARRRLQDVDPDDLEEHYRKRSLLKRSRLSRGHRRGGLLLRLRHVGEIDRQHHQRRRRQRAELHAVKADLPACAGSMSGRTEGSAEKRELASPA